MILEPNKRKFINYILLPFSAIFYILSSIRKVLYRLNIFKIYTSKTTPVIVVGNITVGGTGKTPVVIEIVNFLQKNGKKVGVVSRGYGRENNDLVVIDKDTKVKDCGDEPLLIYQKTAAKIAVSSDRVLAVKELEKDVDIIISDDGLQHLAMGRAFEILVFNGFANGFLLPAGGLRETKSRLKTVDFVLKNADKKIKNLHFINSKTGETKPLNYFENMEVIALCGIANPNRFFDNLTSLNINFEKRVFPDHYNFNKNDLNFEKPVITTAKDWVKYKEFASENMWYLDIKLSINDDFYTFIKNKIL
jgi:tetraacyldisaccharide 4'-kinase